MTPTDIAEAEGMRTPALIVRLKTWCVKRGVSQSALAMKLGISASHLNGIINGRAQPGAGLAQKISDHLHADEQKAGQSCRGRRTKPGRRPMVRMAAGTVSAECVSRLEDAGVIRG